MTATFKAMADAIRVLAMDAVEQANSGHPGMPMGMADVATVLWTRFLKHDPKQPEWADRDRFVLSAGHGSMLLYALLHLSGYEAMTMEELKRFRQLGSLTAGHPEYGHTPGVETTTGPLGQGLGNAVGMAMAERHLNARFGDDLVDHRTWVVAGDGCLMEGLSQEAISLAGRLKLNKLCVLWDDNSITIDGAVGLSDATDQLARFKAVGWAVKRIDGHDEGQIRKALSWATRQKQPTLIACKTRIGKGSPNLEGHQDTHGKALGKAEVAATRANLGWTLEPFVMEPGVEEAWRKAAGRHAGVRRRWERRLAGSEHAHAFKDLIVGKLPEGAFDALHALTQTSAETKPSNATRVHSGAALEQLVPAIPALMGGSADLTGSNNTKTKGMAAFDAPDYAGRYVNWGIREHGMAAAMNGMALHGGVIPYAGTFLTFSDYMRPSIRLAALMGIRVIHVMTHDSIGLGEDGPTHQPVEHLASLRAIPNLNVYRPADAVETAECWELALTTRTVPSILSLSRQKTKAARIERTDENLSARGAYVLRAASAEPKAAIFATGSEIDVALAARELLEAEGVPTRVVSVPCWELFEAQDVDYRNELLGWSGEVKAAVEAGIAMGWERFIGRDGAFIGMTGFGASAPAEQLYKHFGITAEHVVAAVRARLPDAAAA